MQSCALFFRTISYAAILTMFYLSSPAHAGGGSFKSFNGKSGEPCGTPSNTKSGEPNKWQALIDEEIRDTESACGKTFKVSVNCESAKPFEGEWQINDFCARPLAVMRRLCESEPKLKTKLKSKINEVRCEFGKTFSLSLSGKTIVATVDTTTANQDDLVDRFLKQKLKNK